MTIQCWGTPRESGGALFVLVGAPPRARVRWTLTGHGALTAVPSVGTLPITDAKGCAMAVYTATAPAVRGDAISVLAEVHVDA